MPQETQQPPRAQTLSPPHPTLQEGSTGQAVTELQTRLRAAGFDPGGIDGQFGTRTKSAVISFQRANGLSADGMVGPLTWSKLLGSGTTTPGKSIPRDQIVSEARWGVSSERSIHYEQRRPIDGVNQRHKLPLYTDCSGFVTLCYKWAGAPDPNGRNFDGSGYTGTMLQYMRRISQAEARKGDLVIWDRTGTGEHVCMVLETGSDPLLVSHGGESGPRTIRFSAEHAYFVGRFGSGIRVVWLTLPSSLGMTLEGLGKEPSSQQPLMDSNPPAEEQCPGEMHGSAPM